MNCPCCSSSATARLARNTSLGYPTFRCLHCGRMFNKRTATPSNCLQFPTAVVLPVVLWRMRYKLSLRNLAETFLVRGFDFTHEAVRGRGACFAPFITDQLRYRARGKVDHL